MFQKEIEKFVGDLAKVKVNSDTKNPWDFLNPNNIIRRQNLIGYFKKMHVLKPAVLIVGEAPGFRGCGRVGMPFSSEKLILSHPFFSDRNIFTIENVSNPIAEASASIVWKTLDSLNFYPLMWATYPYHPHKSGNIFSNRAPKSEEVLIGQDFLKRLIKLYLIKKVIAVGRVAENTLAEMKIKAFSVRHPSHGGAKLFAQGLKDFTRK